MTKAHTPSFRVPKDSSNIYIWPADVPLSDLENTGTLQTEGGSVPTARRSRHENTIGDGFVRSIVALAIIEETDGILVHGDRTLTVGRPGPSGNTWGRVSILRQSYRGEMGRITVRMPDGTIVTVDVVKLKNS